MMAENINKIEKNKITEFFSTLHQESFAPYSLYDNLAKEVGFSQIQFIDLSENISVNYYRLLQKMQTLQQSKTKMFSADFTERMSRRLKDWEKAGENGLIKWGILHYKK